MKMLLQICLLPLIVLIACVTPSPENVEDYLENTMKSIGINEGVDEEILTPKDDVGSTIYVLDSNRKKELVIHDVGKRIKWDGDSQSKPVSFITNDPWEIYNTENKESFRWYVNDEFTAKTDILKFITGSLGKEQVSEIIYRTHSLYSIKGEIPYLAKAFQFWSFTSSSTSSYDWDNTYLITGVIIELLEVNVYEKWDFKSSVSGDYKGIGGTLYVDKKYSTGTESVVFNSYYIIENMKELALSYAGMEPEEAENNYVSELTEQEKKNLSEFIDVSKNVNSEIIASRLKTDPSFLKVLSSIEWKELPDDYDLESALLLNSDEELLQKAQPPEISPNLKWIIEAQKDGPKIEIAPEVQQMIEDIRGQRK